MEALHRVCVPSRPDAVVIEMQEVGLDLVDGELDDSAVVCLGVRMVSVPVVAVDRTAVCPRFAVGAEHDPVLRLGHLFEQQLPEEGAAVRVDADAQARVVAQLGECNRILHALPLGLEAAAFVAVHHHEVDAQFLQRGDHLGTVFAHIGRALFRRRRIALGAVAPHAKQQRLPTPGHDDAITRQPVRALVKRKCQDAGVQGGGKAQQGRQAE